MTLVNGPRSDEPRSERAHGRSGHLPPDDPVVYKMLQDADTIGVFQVESRAQMATLPRLRPERFYDLVVEVAIIRPGPIVGKMVHPYLNRRAGREPVTYAHPSFEPILARTLGVPLFQEQLLRMAMVTAGFTGGQAEDLRRALGFKRSEKRMKEVEIKLRAGMANNGITGDVAEQIISSITAFALYGFPESHAASFALLAYASAYLKVHFPAAFYTALLNNQPMGFYHPATLVKDAQRRGVRFTGVDVQHSDWLCRVDADGRVRLGLRYVSGLREESGKAIERRQRGRIAARSWQPSYCPKCGCDDESMIETVNAGSYFCNMCSHDWSIPTDPRTRRNPRFPLKRPAFQVGGRFWQRVPAFAAKSCRRSPTSAPSHRSATSAAKRFGRLKKPSALRESFSRTQKPGCSPAQSLLISRSPIPGTVPAPAMTRKNE